MIYAVKYWIPDELLSSSPHETLLSNPHTPSGFVAPEVYEGRYDAVWPLGHQTGTGSTLLLFHHPAISPAAPCQRLSEDAWDPECKLAEQESES